MFTYVLQIKCLNDRKISSIFISELLCKGTHKCNRFCRSTIMKMFVYQDGQSNLQQKKKKLLPQVFNIEIFPFSFFFYPILQRRAGTWEYFIVITEPLAVLEAFQEIGRKDSLRHFNIHQAAPHVRRQSAVNIPTGATDCQSFGENGVFKLFFFSFVIEAFFLKRLLLLRKKTK